MKSALSLAWRLCLAQLLWTAPLAATPLLAIKEANNCQGCHNPGRSQRPPLERRCTLDCQGCHVDPSGAGPRNQWGYYYSQDQLATFNFFKPQDPLKDESRFDLHADGRIIKRQVGDEERTFPMSEEISLRVRPFVKYLSLTYQAMLLGRVGDQSFRATRSDERRFREKYSIMVDNLPLNTYIRAYRGAPMYGLREPNHSLWIRERIGMDQFAQTDAVQIGGTPNVPFFHASVMQGDPAAEPEDRQKGVSTHFGMRGVSFGWHLFGDTWNTASEKNAIEMRQLAAGVKPWKFIFTGQRNWRKVTDKLGDLTGAERAELESEAPRVHPSSRIDQLTSAFSHWGVTLGRVDEKLDDTTRDSRRKSYFVDFHPIPFLQFEIWRRFETGTNELTDTLAILHLYADY
jgi:hypothetical protein